MIRLSTSELPAGHAAGSHVAARAKLFRALGDPSRLAILDALRGGPRNVGELARATGLGQPNVSNHLACLLGCGLVRRETRGRFAFYALSDARVETLFVTADGLLDGPAAGILDCPACAARDAASSAAPASAAASIVSD